MQISNGSLKRCNSASEDNLLAADSNEKSPEFEQSFTEKSMSHENVLRESSADTNSTDSLARKALLAAQVLHLIPASRARQRNFLQGRAGTYSLLGQHELEQIFPNREITIFVGTWNMNGHSHPK